MVTSRCPDGETVREHYAHGGKLFDEDLVTPEHLLHESRLDRMRHQLPETAKAMAQVVVDNPGQFVLLGSGAFVFARILANMVRPRNPVEALALMVVASTAGGYLAGQAAERGILKFRIRDEHGKLVDPFSLGPPGDA